MVGEGEGEEERQRWAWARRPSKGAQCSSRALSDVLKPGREAWLPWLDVLLRLPLEEGSVGRCRSCRAAKARGGAAAAASEEAWEEGGRGQCKAEEEGGVRAVCWRARV